MPRGQHKIAKFEIVVDNSTEEDLIFRLLLSRDNEVMGNVSLYTHPDDSSGAQLDVYIEPKWRCRWLTKELAKEVLAKAINMANLHKISIVYTTALTSVSPRVLEFFGFMEYNKQQPKTYYYYNLEVANGTQ